MSRVCRFWPITCTPNTRAASGPYPSRFSPSHSPAPLTDINVHDKYPLLTPYPSRFSPSHTVLHLTDPKAEHSYAKQPRSIEEFFSTRSSSRFAPGAWKVSIVERAAGTPTKKALVAAAVAASRGAAGELLVIGFEGRKDPADARKIMGSIEDFSWRDAGMPTLVVKSDGSSSSSGLLRGMSSMRLGGSSGGITTGLSRHPSWLCNSASAPSAPPPPKFLVAVDGSRASHGALEFILRVRQPDDDVHVLHIERHTAEAIMSPRGGAGTIDEEGQEAWARPGCTGCASTDLGEVAWDATMAAGGSDSGRSKRGLMHTKAAGLVAGGGSGGGGAAAAASSIAAGAGTANSVHSTRNLLLLLAPPPVSPRGIGIGGVGGALSARRSSFSRSSGTPVPSADVQAPGLSALPPMAGSKHIDPATYASSPSPSNPTSPKMLTRRGSSSALIIPGQGGVTPTGQTGPGLSSLRSMNALPLAHTVGMVSPSGTSGGGGGGVPSTESPCGSPRQQLGGPCLGPSLSLSPLAQIRRGSRGDPEEGVPCTIASWYAAFCAAQNSGGEAAGASSSSTSTPVGGGSTGVVGLAGETGDAHPSFRGSDEGGSGSRSERRRHGRVSFEEVPLGEFS